MGLHLQNLVLNRYVRAAGDVLYLALHKTKARLCCYLFPEVFVDNK